MLIGTYTRARTHTHTCTYKHTYAHMFKGTEFWAYLLFNSCSSALAQNYTGYFDKEKLIQGTGLADFKKLEVKHGNMLCR